jgi:hypothetical protein
MSVAREDSGVVSLTEFFEALEPVRQGVHRCFAAIAPGVAHGLKLRHDHGSNYMSGDFQDEIECPGDRSFAPPGGATPRLFLHGNFSMATITSEGSAAALLAEVAVAIPRCPA